MKLANRIFIVLFILCGLFLIGDNEYYNNTLGALLILSISYFIVFVVYHIRKF